MTSLIHRQLANGFTQYPIRRYAGQMQNEHSMTSQRVDIAVEYYKLMSLLLRVYRTVFTSTYYIRLEEGGPHKTGRVGVLNKRFMSSSGRAYADTIESEHIAINMMSSKL